MGRVVAPFGVHGWMRVEHYTESPGALLDHPVWWVRQGNGPWQPRALEQGAVRALRLVAKLEGMDTPEAVVALHDAQLGVPRADLPDSAPGEYYFSDLIGLPVVNLAGEALGSVTLVLETGANEVLVVKGERERLIPFIDTVIRSVELGQAGAGDGRIVVDWGSDF